MSVAVSDAVFATKALKKFLTTLTSRSVARPARSRARRRQQRQLLRRTARLQDFRRGHCSRISIGTCAKASSTRFPKFLEKRFTQLAGTVDGILCWDLIDYLDKNAAQALADELTRLLRPDGALLGFFGTAQPRDTRYTKFIIVDDVNLKHRSYQAARGRQAILLNRDIIRLFAGLRVSDSFLLQNNLREILFRKPAA